MRELYRAVIYSCRILFPLFSQTESNFSGAPTKTKTQHLNLMWKRRELGFAARIVGVGKFAADLRLLAFALLPRLTTAAWKWLRPHIGGRLAAPVPCSVIWATFALHPDDREDERENNDNDNNESVSCNNSRHSHGNGFGPKFGKRLHKEDINSVNHTIMKKCLPYI